MRFAAFGLVVDTLTTAAARQARRKGTRNPDWDLGLASYRAMVINHETGHWFYLKHTGCPGAGQPAPVMQQQSIALRGCLPNPWPTAREVRAATGARV